MRGRREAEFGHLRSKKRALEKRIWWTLSHTAENSEVAGAWLSGG